MEITTFLAMLWGPALLAIGVGVLVSRSFYTRIYRDLEKEPLATLAFSLSAIAAGVAHVYMHNLWGSLAEGVISALGWGLLLKGIALAVFPAFGDRMGNWAAKTKLLNLSAPILLIVGAYLTWVAFA